MFKKLFKRLSYFFDKLLINRCPVCDSKNIKKVPIGSNPSPVWEEVCEDCGYKVVHYDSI